MRLEVKNIYKSFGDKEVLKDMSFTVESGRALGLLGRNGAGKTTTIRIIMGIFLQDKGSVLIDGVENGKANARIGYMPEERGLYPKKKVLEQMTYIGELRGLKASQAKKRAAFLLEKLEATEFLNKRLDTLSKGNQQKIQLAIALLHDPDIVILDEPFSGLDPVNAGLLKKMVEELVGYGKIVVFSSHQMSYVEEFCREVCILNNGRIVLSGLLSDIKKSYPRNRVRIIPESEPGRVLEMINESKLACSVEPVFGGCLVTLRTPSCKRELLASLAASGLGIDAFTVVEPTLEEIFVEKVGESHEAV